MTPPSGRGDDARLSKDNRQNAIYVSAYTFIVSNNLDSGEETGWAKPDLNIMFMLSSPDDYQSFVKAAKKADAELKDGYEISSPSLEAYRKSIAPLGALNDTMRITMIALWVAGGLLLVALGGLRRPPTARGDRIRADRGRVQGASRLAVHAGGLDGDAAGVRDRRAGRRIRPPDRWVPRWPTAMRPR